MDDGEVAEDTEVQGDLNNNEVETEEILCLETETGLAEGQLKNIFDFSDEDVSHPVYVQITKQDEEDKRRVFICDGIYEVEAKLHENYQEWCDNGTITHGTIVQVCDASVAQNNPTDLRLDISEIKILANDGELLVDEPEKLTMVGHRYGQQQEQEIEQNSELEPVQLPSQNLLQSISSSQQRQQQQQQRQQKNPQLIKKEPNSSSQKKRTMSQIMNSQRNRSNNNRNANRSQSLLQPSSSASERFVPIASLNPYQSRNWQIKVRITEIKPIHEWTKERSQGKVLGFYVMDEKGDEINVSAFGAECDRFKDMLQVDQMYIINRGRIKYAKYRAGRIKHEYDICATRDTQITHLANEVVPLRKFKFTKIAQLENLEPNTFSDIVGVVKEVHEFNEFVSKKGKDLKKRGLTLVDDTCHSVNITLWGSRALEFDENKLGGKPVVIFPGCKVSDYGGISLSAGGPPIINNEAYAEVIQLKNWWSGGGSDENFSSMSSGRGGPAPRITSWRHAVQAKLGHNSDKPEYFELQGVIQQINYSIEKPPWYKSVPNLGEGEKAFKVEEQDDGKYFCPKNDKTYDTYDPRWILRCCISDSTGGHWVSAFNDAGKTLIGMQASEAEKILNEQGADEFEQIFTNATWKTHVFKIRAKLDTYTDENKIRYDLQQVTSIDFRKEAQENITFLMENM